jgi:hypothetical protein
MSAPDRTRRRGPVARHLLAAAALLGLVALPALGCVLDWDPSHRTTSSGSGSSSSGTLTEKSCEAGSTCSLDCPEGSCLLRCGSTASCDLSCVGGGCIFHCDNTGDCTAHCPGGKCAMYCDNSPSCTEACGPGDCTQTCSFTPTTCSCTGCN